MSANENAKYHLLRARLYLLNNEDKNAFLYYKTAKKKYIALDSLETAASINAQIVSMLVALGKKESEYKPYLDEYFAYASKENDPAMLSEAYMISGKAHYFSNLKMALSDFMKALDENLKTDDMVYRGRIFQNIGVIYASDSLRQFNLALTYYGKAMKIYEEHHLNDYMAYIYMNMGIVMKKTRKIKDAITFFRKADSMKVKEFKKKNLTILYSNLSECYEETKDYSKALEYSRKEKIYRDILDETTQSTAIKEIDTKYRSVETKLENQSLKKANSIIIVCAGGIVLLLMTFTVLIYKNISKKKKIAEQEKLIQVQKHETILKNQELHEIDVMLESQEKERQRIANELHDNLGSILATLKLNFQNLKRQPIKTVDEEILYDRTDSLIEEAYQNVRNISHLKNLGVIGNEGLLPSVIKMAEKMSILKKFEVNVIPFGLEGRLENSLEISLFRIIQELCTNIMKHADAQQANIYLMLHGTQSINIIIEDDGNGFDQLSIAKRNGMGLANIQKKVTQMQGTFEIDSQKSKGTTIIIDIPL